MLHLSWLAATNNFFEHIFISSWAKQLLCNDVASEPCLPYPPGTFGKVSAHCLIPSFCHLCGYCLLSEHGFGFFGWLVAYTIALSEQEDWIFDLVLWAWCKKNILLTVPSFDCCCSCPSCLLMVILSTLALVHLLMLPHRGISIHTSFRWVLILLLQMSTGATCEIMPKKGCTAEVTLLKQRTCCKWIASQSKHLCHPAVDYTGSVKFSTCLIIMLDVSHCWVSYSSMRGQSSGQWNKIWHGSWKEMKLNTHFWRNTNKQWPSH